MTEKSKKSALYFLLIPILFLALFAYSKDKSYRTLEETLLQEKIALEAELDEIISDYKGVKVEKKDLSKRLIREMNKIISLKDSLKNLDAAHYGDILRFRKRIVTLERENRDLFAEVDSINVVNSYLKIQNNKIIKELTVKEKEKEALEFKIKELEQFYGEKIAIASVLKVENLDAVVMKERRSGKLTRTSRSSRADAFRIKFRLLKNEIASPGKKQLFVQITNSKGGVIASKSTFKTKDGKKLFYSDKLTANYNNESLEVLSLILVNRANIQKGKYNVNIFINGIKSGTQKIKLR